MNSELGALNISDWLKGLVLTVLSAVATIVYTTAQSGDLTLDAKKIEMVAISTACAYFLKNVFTGSGGKLLTNASPGEAAAPAALPPPPPTGTVTVPTAPPPSAPTKTPAETK